MKYLYSDQIGFRKKLAFIVKESLMIFTACVIGILGTIWNLCLHINKSLNLRDL